MKKNHASLIHRLLLLSDIATNGNEAAKVAVQNEIEKNSAYKAALRLLATSKALEYAAENLIDYKDENTLEDGSNAELDQNLSRWTNMLQAIFQELVVYIEPDSSDSPGPLDMDWIVGE